MAPAIKVSDKIIKELFRTYSVKYTTGEIIKYSSNVGAVTVALSMGKKIFWESIKKYGFGQPTGIDLPGEEAGLFSNYEDWSGSTIGALAIGQSISVTPLQLVRAACVIANGGYLVMPNVVKEIRFQNGNLKFHPKKKKLELSKKHG